MDVDGGDSRDGGGMSDSDGSSWGLSSNNSMGSWEATVDTSEETGVAKDLGLSISRSLAVVVAVVMGIWVSVSISSVAQSVVTQSITVVTIVGISLRLSLGGTQTAGNSQGEDNL